MKDLFRTALALTGVLLLDYACPGENPPNINPTLGSQAPTREDRKAVEWWSRALQPVKSQGLRMARKSNPSLAVSNLCMVAQVVTPENDAEDANQLRELAWFKTRGFNGAVLVWKGENPEKLVGVAQTLNKAGWTLAWTFGPEEGYSEKSGAWRNDVGNSNVYVDPDAFRRAAKLLSPYCAFAIPGWRRATVHHFREWKSPFKAIGGDDGERYQDMLIGMIREAASDLPIMGVWSLPTTSSVITEEIKPEWDGTVILEAAYEGYRLPRVVKRLERLHVPRPSLFVLCGPHPYWDGQDPAGNAEGMMRAALDYNLATVRELSGLNCGAIVLGMGGGGTRNVWRRELSDDLTRTSWSKLSSK